MKQRDPCPVCGASSVCRYDGTWYCNKHYLRLHNNGTTELVGRKRTTTYAEEDGIGYITTRKGEVIKIDAEDADKAMRYSWCISKTGYPVANIRHKVTKLHRYLMGVTDPTIVVDHRNGDRLDARKSNLRICTNEENARNKGLTTGNRYGISGIRQTAGGKFNVRITIDGNETHIGNFATLEEAIDARKRVENEVYGEYAYTNRKNEEAMYE